MAEHESFITKLKPETQQRVWTALRDNTPNMAYLEAHDWLEGVAPAYGVPFNQTCDVKFENALIYPLVHFRHKGTRAIMIVDGWYLPYRDIGVTQEMTAKLTKVSVRPIKEATKLIEGCYSDLLVEVILRERTLKSAAQWVRENPRLL